MSELQVNPESESWNKAVNVYAKGSKYGYIFEHFSNIAAKILLFNEPESISLLDNASGTGTLTIELLSLINEEKMNNSSFVVTDFATAMVETAKLQIVTLFNPPNIQFEVMDSQSLKFSSNSFSHIGCMFGVHHVTPSYQKALSEMSRVLKPDGICVIATWFHADFAVMDKFLRFLKLYDENTKTSGENRRDIGKYPEIFQPEIIAAGFTNVEIQQHEHTFMINNDLDFFKFNATSPILKDKFSDIEVLYPIWNEFLDTNEGIGYLTEDKKIFKLKMIANISICSK